MTFGLYTTRGVKPVEQATFGEMLAAASGNEDNQEKLYAQIHAQDDTLL